MPAGDAKGVVHHQDLTVGHVACANTNHRNRQGFSNTLRQLNRHALQHQQLGACGFQRQGIIKQRLGGVTAALHFISTKDVDGLRRQAQMAAHRHGALGEHLHRIHQPGAAFNFDHVSASTHDRCRVFECLLRRGIGHKRQIGKQQAGWSPAAHRTRVVSDILNRDRQGGIMSLYRHP